MRPRGLSRERGRVTVPVVHRLGATAGGRSCLAGRARVSLPSDFVRLSDE